MSRSPRTVTTTTAVAPPPWLATQQQDFLGRADALSREPHTPFTGPLVAGLTADQTLARNLLRGRLAAPQPGKAALEEIIGAGFVAPERNRFLNADNPYLQATVDNTLGDITRAFAQQRAPEQMAQFARGGAFGGSAFAEAQAESQRALAQELGRAASGLRAADFDARRQLAESEVDRLTNTRLAAGAQRLQALTQLRDLDAMDGQRIGMLDRFGEDERAYMQQQMDANYGQFRDSRDWNRNRLGIFGDAIGVVAPSWQNQTQTGPNPRHQSRLQQMLGLGLTGLGIWSGLRK